jgi:hypothetical protein
MVDFLFHTLRKKFHNQGRPTKEENILQKDKALYKNSLHPGTFFLAQHFQYKKLIEIDCLTKNFNVMNTKKKFFTVITALFFIAVTSGAFAINSYTNENGNITIEQAEVTFEEVELDQVPDAVKEAAKKNSPGGEIVKAEVANIGDKKVYKLTINNGGENIISLFSEDGEPYTPES